MEKSFLVHLLLSITIPYTASKPTDCLPNPNSFIYGSDEDLYTACDFLVAKNLSPNLIPTLEQSTFNHNNSHDSSLVLAESLKDLNRMRNGRRWIFLLPVAAKVAIHGINVLGIVSVSKALINKARRHRGERYVTDHLEFDLENIGVYYNDPNTYLTLVLSNLSSKDKRQLYRQNIIKLIFNALSGKLEY